MPEKEVSHAARKAFIRNLFNLAVKNIALFFTKPNLLSLVEELKLFSIGGVGPQLAVLSIEMFFSSCCILFSSPEMNPRDLTH